MKRDWLTAGLIAVAFTLLVSSNFLLYDWEYAVTTSAMFAAIVVAAFRIFVFGHRGGSQADRHDG